MPDLLLNQDAFYDGSRKLREKCDELKLLRDNLDNAFEQLRKDWNSEAGRSFFERFENDLIKNFDDYLLVFEHMSNNLTTASYKYEEVFGAAESVAESEY